MIPMVTKIDLEWHEVLSCATIGVQRRIESQRKGLKDRPGFQLVNEVWDLDINGACGELAVAKALGMYWPASINSFHKPDLEGIQVRLSRSERPYLIVQKNESPEDKFVLVTGTVPHFRVIGWAFGRQVKNPLHLTSFQGRPEVYALPLSQLTPIMELKNVKSRRRKSGR